MKQRTKISLLTLTLGVASMPALAQDDTTGTTTQTTRNDNGGMDWGWLGLLGLAGLAGLRRKAPTVVHHQATTPR